MESRLTINQLYDWPSTSSLCTTDKDIPVPKHHAMKAYSRHGDRTPYIFKAFNRGAGQLHTPASLPLRILPPVPTG